jgi:hypothetical protein
MGETVPFALPNVLVKFVLFTFSTKPYTHDKMDEAAAHESCMLWLPDLVLVRLIDYLLPSSDAHGTQVPPPVGPATVASAKKNLAETQHIHVGCDEPGRIPEADVPSHKRSLNSALGGLEGGQETAASTLYHYSSSPPKAHSVPYTRTTFAHRHDDVDQYGQRTLRSRMSSVLALRATCRSLRLAVDMIVRLPPLDFVPRLQAWLVANLGAPPLQLNNSFSSDFHWAARLVSSSAHAELQQLRFGRSSFPARRCAVALPLALCWPTG